MPRKDGRLPASHLRQKFIAFSAFDPPGVRDAICHIQHRIRAREAARVKDVRRRDRFREQGRQSRKHCPDTISREGRDLQPTFPADRRITNRRQWHSRVRPWGIIRGLCNSQEDRPTLRAREGDHLRENLITSIITKARLAAEPGMHFPRSVGKGFFEFNLITSGQVWAGSPQNQRR